MIPGHGTPTAERHAKFIEGLREGHRWQEWLGERWRAAGLRVVVPPLRIRDRFANRAAYRDAADLFVNGWPIEVKAHSVSFTGPDDYPFVELMCGSWKRWREMVQKPIAIVVISKPKLSVVAVSARTEPKWGGREVYNARLDVGNETILVPRELLQSEGALLSALRGR